MKKLIIVITIIAVVAGCKNKADDNKFIVSGVIANSKAKMIFLDEVPMATMQRRVVDSAVIGTDGKYELQTTKEEARVYNLRVNNNDTPVADIINDQPAITVDINYNQESMYPEYNVKNSPATIELKEFLVTFNKQLQSIYTNDIKTDSIRKNGGSDSALGLLAVERLQIGKETKNQVLLSINKLINPALAMMQLGYYQSTANIPAYNLEPISDEEVGRTVNSIAAKFPEHKGLEQIKNSMNAELNNPESNSTGIVGNMAPEISLPDVNDKLVTLSSFRGKYVLIDFWASWCGPCRAENPNVVAAFNKFKNKNFTILGVSLDRPGQKDKWLAAIKQDNLQWTHVSDLLYWQSSVIPTYRLNAIPYNVLVDPSGKVIAENLTGPSLENKLVEVLK